MNTMSQESDAAHEFKIFDFIAKDEASEVDLSDEDSDDGDSRFIIQIFGINARGEKAHIRVEHFTPFFYVKVADSWRQRDKEALFSHLKGRLGNNVADKIIDCRLIARKKLYGFDSGTMHKFVCIKFADMATFRAVKKLWFVYKQMPDGSNERVLAANGYTVNGCATRIYESFIPPLLRLFHMKNISPSGWISVNKSDIIVAPVTKTTCEYEFSVHYNNITALPDKETSVPYKIMSFDIEASSSHGDFPVPVKSYKKLGSDILDYFDKFPAENNADAEARLRSIIRSAFGFSKNIATLTTDELVDLAPEDPQQHINVVYPNKPLIADQVTHMTDILFNANVSGMSKTECGSATSSMRTIEDMFSNINEQYKNLADGDDGDNDGETDSEDGDSVSSHASTKRTSVQSSNNITGILVDRGDYSRDERLTNLVSMLGGVFPPLKGDMVTFIGSTFLEFGKKSPHLSHCIVLNSCDAVPVENSIIESYDTEREVLLAWQRLVQRENPDIIIGYNIFGFDYEFMYHRSSECNCTQEFLQMSRVKNEVCGTYNDRADKFDIERTSGAGGDFSYINMGGRMQIDLLYWFKRTENWNSYKLDSVSSTLIGDVVTKTVHIPDDGNSRSITTRVHTKNMSGLSLNSYVHFDEINHSSNSYKDGKKFKVVRMDVLGGWFEIPSKESPSAKTVKWGLAKDDITYKDIFRMTNEGSASRATIAKYCMQDCNLVHQLCLKVDVMTDLIEMSRLCSVPMSFLVFRGQGIKLTSYVAKKCREFGYLMPDINKGNMTDGYEGAIVLDPKVGFYDYDSPVPVGDFSSLYPSCMLSENLCPSSKVWSKIYNLDGVLISESGAKSGDESYTYDNLPGYSYVDVTFDTFRYVRKTPKAKAMKVKSGHKVCRFAKNGETRSIMPSILSELLKARKDTRRRIPTETDDFMKNVLDKRQLAYKVTANSLYGQLGAKTSTFYEPDIAASTTATGRLLLTYAQRIVVECYDNVTVPTTHGDMNVTAEYIYGDTDSVFFKFVVKDAASGAVVTGIKNLELAIEISKVACNLVSQFLKQPHDFEYEKTFAPFCLLSKKRYVGMLYESDPTKGKRKEMGIVLKRRDNAPIVKDVYGGVIDILMQKEGNGAVFKSIDFVNSKLELLVNKAVPLDKLIISKSLRSFYKMPKQQCHKVLADRIGLRDPGNKPSPGDRIPYIYIVNNSAPKKKLLQGDKIESPAFIVDNNLPIDYAHYITNQIMKPLQQLFGLVLPDIWKQRKKIMKLNKFNRDVDKLNKEFAHDYKKRDEKIAKITNAEVKSMIFEKYLRDISNQRAHNRNITQFFVTP